MKTFLCGFLLLLTGCALGFFAGRRSLRQPATVEYVQEPAQTGAVERPEPITIEAPALPALPVRTDTVYVDSLVYIVEKVDTAAIIADYELKRSYAMKLFDNEYGKLDVSLSTQYNRLGAIPYEFIPVTKTVYLEKTWQPFAMIQYGSIGGISVGAGTFYRKVGYYIMYTSDFRRQGFGAGVMTCF